MRFASAWMGALLLAACGGDGGGKGTASASDASVDAEAGVDGAPDSGGVDAPAPIDLRVFAGENRYALVGEEVTLDGSASVNAVEYQWQTGLGAVPRRQASPTTTVVYDAPGRYTAILTGFDARGNPQTDTVVISVTLPATHTPRGSGPIVALDARALAAVSTDSDELVFIEWTPTSATVRERVSVGRSPRSVARFGDDVAVVCQDAAQVELISATDGTAARTIVALPAGSRPFGAVAVADQLFVTLQGTGELAVVTRDAAGAAVTATHPVIEDARGISMLPDGRLVITRFRSPADRGEIAVFSPGDAGVEIIALAMDTGPSTSNRSGGVPSYLGRAYVSPTGLELAIPSLQANDRQGTFNTGDPLTFESTVRAALSRVPVPQPDTMGSDAGAPDAGADASGGAPDVEPRRTLFDNRGFASAAAFSSRGDYLYVTMRGNGILERFDMLTDLRAGSLRGLGTAPDGVVLSDDGSTLFVLSNLGRTLAAYGAESFSDASGRLFQVTLPSSDPLDAVSHRGKELFNTSADARLARDGYIACAHCHLEGDSDRRVWDFTDRGEGLRNTISLWGKAGLGDGPLHWTANFDEVQDFEHDVRNAFGGTGLMAEDDFIADGRDTSLGGAKAGVSTDLDALAAYVTSLATEPRSPFRRRNGNLTNAAIAGKALFESAALGCATCHSGPRLTDSSITGTTPVLHDVETASAGSGQRLGTTLTGFDTPTLHGLWHSAPYLHDGSAATLRDVLTTRNPNDAHGVTSTLSISQLDQLERYLLSLDGRLD